MRRQSLFGFILVNIAVTILVAAGVIFAYTRLAPAPTPRESPPLMVYITTTPQLVQTQVVYVVVTATPFGTAPNLNASPAATNALAGTVSEASSALPNASPLDPTDAAATASAATQATGQSTTADNSPTPASLPTDPVTGCPVYAVRKGDVPGSIADSFGVSLADLYNANHLKVNPLLQIGQPLIIPVNGCGLSTATPTPTATSPSSPTPLPTSTMLPTAVPAVQASLSITQVIRPGDITAEGVEIKNNSTTDTADLTGWTISDGSGDTFTFPAYRLFPNGSVTVNTRTGSNTPRVLFWGRSTALWGKSGATVTLSDSTAAVQSTYTVGSVGSTPGG